MWEITWINAENYGGLGCFFPWVQRPDLFGTEVTHLQHVLGVWNKDEMKCRYYPGGQPELFNLQLIDQSLNIR